MRILQKSIFFLLLICHICSQCCIRFDGKNCVQCPDGTHLFRGNCLFDVKDCAKYRDGFQCAACNSGFNLNSTGDCVKIVPVGPVTQPQSLEDSGFIEVMINPQKLEGAAGDSYSICDDYLRTVKQQLAKAKTKACRVRTYKNKSSQIIIQYEVNKNTLYRAILQLNLDSFIVRENSFTEVKDSIFNKQTTAQFKTQPINLNNLSHSEKFFILDSYLKNQNQQIGSLKSGNITGLSDGGHSFSVVYMSKNQGWEFMISAIVSKDKAVKILENKSTPLKLVPGTIGNLVNKEILDASKSQNTQRLNENSQTSVSYQTLGPEDDSDENIILCRDLIQTQNSQFLGLQPSKIKRLIQGSNVSFIFTYTRPDGSVYEVYSQINIQNLVIRVTKITQVLSPNKNTPLDYKKMSNEQAFQDPHFLIVYDYIIKQSSKYNTANIQSVEKSLGKSVNNFKIFFQLDKILWEVLAYINVLDFLPGGFVQKKQQVVNNSNNKDQSTSFLNLNSAQTSPQINPPPSLPSILPNQLKAETNQFPINNQPSLPGRSQNDQNSRSIDKCQGIRQRMLGMNELAKGEQNSMEFKQIDRIIRSPSQPDIKNGQILCTFTKMMGFSKTFQIYYESQLTIYEAVVTRDVIRKKNYFISLGKYGY